MSQQLWAADPHQYGPGKVHIIDGDDKAKTLCGRFTSATPGKPTSAAKATCLICLNAVVSRPEYEKRQAEYEKQRLEREEARSEENRAWQAWYQTYLRSPAWAVLRVKVMQRAGGTCEGCLVTTATEVHHTTYEHVGAELLWELRAICRSCHERVTSLDREKRGVS